MHWNDENDILNAFRTPTIIPVYDEFGGSAGTRAAGFNDPSNSVANLDRQKDNRGFATSGFGDVYLEFEPIPDLVLRSEQVIETLILFTLGPTLHARMKTQRTTRQ